MTTKPGLLTSRTVLGYTMRTIQNTFDQLDFASSAKETANAQLFCHTFCSQDTNFTSPSKPALSGLWAAPICYFEPLTTPK
jgi:hypothetical protein